MLDIVSSSTGSVHPVDMIAEVILGDPKFINTEVPPAIEGLKCHKCGTVFENLRSFKCHNWAYAKEALVKVIQEMQKRK